MVKVSQMTVGHQSRVVDITAEMIVRERLLEMGVAPGRNIRLVRKMPFMGPFVIQAGSMFLALRADEADHIWVETL